MEGSLMETEKLNVFDENRNLVGIATRAEVHKKGLWHKTFHCWFVSHEEEKKYIFFQLRSNSKKDYPNLFDITAAGHILANESIADGVREVEEEVGIKLSFNELVSLGEIKYSALQGDLIDNELANVFLYNYKKTMDDFLLQTEEVSGIVKADFESFSKLFTGKTDQLEVKGFEINHVGEKTLLHTTIGKNSFVPHDDSYYEEIIDRIKNHRNKVLG
jgi:isopentenyldiphosphate isomerase